MINIAQEEMQYMEIDSFLPRMFNSFLFRGKNIMSYELILILKSPLAEKFAAEYEQAREKETPVMMKILNTQFSIQNFETTPQYRLSVASEGVADSLQALVEAGLKIISKSNKDSDYDHM